MNTNLCTKECDNSPAAIETALRQIRTPEPNFELRITVDGKRVNREEVQVDGTGMCFYQFRPIIPVSVSVFKPDFGKLPSEKTVADIDFWSLEPLEGTKQIEQKIDLLLKCTINDEPRT